jgi:beta-galactosidase
MMTTESFPADAFEQWSIVQDHPFVLGEFVWTAMDYLGESGIGAWSYGTAKQATQMSQMKNFLRTYMAKMGADGKNPMAASQDGGPPNPLFPGFPWHAAYCGDLDLTGFRKPSSYYRDIVWNGGDRVFVTVRLPETEDKKIIAAGWSVFPTLPSWTWPGQEGKPITVEVYSGTDAVRLYLNDKLIGEKTTGREQAFKAAFEVPFTSGTLRADGVRAGKVVAESVLQTVGDPVRLKLTSDRTVLDANGQDLAFVTVEAVDDKGRLQINADQKVQVALSGAGTIAATGNGDGQSQESYSGDTFNLFHGRALVVLRTTRKAGAIKLTAHADGLTASSLVVESKSAEPLAELR